MRIAFSRHATQRIKWRRIEEKEIIETIEMPENTEPSVFGRKNAFKKIGAKPIKVTYIEEGNEIVVISAVDKNKQEVYMKIEFDKKADALYIYIQEKPVNKTKEIEEGVLVDFDEEGRLIGLEVLDVTKRFSLSDIVNLRIENLPVEIPSG